MRRCQSIPFAKFVLKNSECNLMSRADKPAFRIHLKYLNKLAIGF